MAEWNLSPTDFTRFAKLTSGTRRPLLVWLGSLSIGAEENDLRIDFELPSGSYATSLLREFMKSSDDDK